MKKSLTPSVIAGIVAGISLLLVFLYSEIQITEKLTLADYVYVYMGLLVAINALFFFFTYDKPKKSLAHGMAFLSGLTGIYGAGIFVMIPPF